MRTFDVGMEVNEGVGKMVEMYGSNFGSFENRNGIIEKIEWLDWALIVGDADARGHGMAIGLTVVREEGVLAAVGDVCDFGLGKKSVEGLDIFW